MCARPDYYVPRDAGAATAKGSAQMTGSRRWALGSFGKHNPYYGVLSYDEFRSGALDENAKRKFFAGVEVVDSFIAVAEESFGPLRYGTALDYGCGVGRLTYRLSECFRQVIGVDISRDMLEEARRNVAERDNVRFEHAGSPDTTPLDFAMSKIVFQHIPPGEGVPILLGLARRLVPGGVGILDLPVRYTGGSLRRAISAVRGLLPAREPIMPLHIYDLQKVKTALAQAGCETRERLSQGPLCEKVVLVFRRMGPPGFEPGTDGL